MVGRSKPGSQLRLVIRMNILLTGATGFVGQALLSQLEAHDVWCLVRRAVVLPRNAKAVTDVNQIDSRIDAVINLAGENIGARRWSAKRKAALRDSRIKLTQKLGQDLQQHGHRPTIWINASAVGFYGDCPGRVVNEDDAAGSDFAAKLCADWEAAARQAAGDARLVVLRLGVVIGPGGMLDKIVLPFRLGLGAVMGPGPQHMPWIARSDVVGVIVKMLEEEDKHGVYNLVGPQSVSQKDFAMALGRVLRRPVLFRFPSAVLRLMMGEMSALLLVDQQVSAQRLTASGYIYASPTIDEALRAALRSE